MSLELRGPRPTPVAGDTLVWLLTLGAGFLLMAQIKGSVLPDVIRWNEWREWDGVSPVLHSRTAALLDR